MSLARLAERLVKLIAPGKVFFANSGAEANEGLYKLARRFGHDEGRFEVLTTVNSFHGRTLAGIAATGQEKVKKGFEPMVPGFRQVPYNDLEAMRAALSPAGPEARRIDPWRRRLSGTNGTGRRNPRSSAWTSTRTCSDCPPARREPVPPRQWPAPNASPTGVPN